MNSSVHFLYQNSDDVQNELKQRTDNIIVSASALNKYLNCPREYYYANILDVPVFADDVDNLSFGAAVHFALEKMARVGKERGNYPTLEEVLGYFKEKISAL